MTRFARRLFPIRGLPILAFLALLLAAPAARSAPRIVSVLPGVVRITTHALVPIESVRAGGGPPATKAQESFGAGFIVDRSGYIVTNRHVIKGAYEIIVYLNDGTPLRARVIGHGGDIDLALIKVDTEYSLQPVEFGDSDKLSIGDPVYVVGNPFGLGTAVSSGVVSALNRDLGFSVYDSFIQTDAPINHGNSGGPMSNANGEVVGVNTAYYTGGNSNGGSIGLGFAIPSNTAREIVGLLKQYGYLRIGWIGVEGTAFTPEMANALGAAASPGAAVSDVRDDGPAAGLIQRGDIVLDVDGKPVDDMRMLRRRVAASLGRLIVFKILRSKKVVTVSVTPAEWPGARVDDRPPQRPGADIPSMATGFGVACAPISKEIRNQFQIGKDQTGVVVTDVQPNSPASEAGLQIGDVVVTLQMAPVHDPSDIAARIAETISSKRDYVTMLVQRGRQYKYITVPAKWRTPPT